MNQNLEQEFIWLDELITNKLVDAYEQGGQQAVEQLCDQIGITKKSYCEPCEERTPVYKSVCAVCFTLSKV